jgi:hypothetical protein
MQVNVPPAGGTQINIYGVTEEDLAVLMALFELELVEGRLPRPRSNEVFISQATAMNRGLRVGDKVGRPVQEAQANLVNADDIPMEMEVVGLFDRSDLWVGFASREYLESHELTESRPAQLLVVPVTGRKAELDTWLTESIDPAQARADTYTAVRERFMQTLRVMFVLFAAVEFLIAAVAAIALAALNTIFFAQRRAEFGTLHALGLSRLWLAFRTVKETGGAVGLAWLIGAVLCILGLIGLQGTIYAPRGLDLNLLSLAPWLFTVPIPLTVILVGAGTIARMLSKLDPVAVIERR